MCGLTWRRLSPVGQLALRGLGQGVTGHCKNRVITVTKTLTYAHNTGSTAVQDLNPSNYISVSQDSPHKQSDYSTDFTTCYQTSGPVQKHRCFVAGRFIVFSNKDNTKLTCK